MAGVIEFGRAVARAEEFLTRAGLALGTYTDITSAAEELRRSSGIKPQELLREYRRNGSVADAVLVANKDKLLATMQAGWANSEILKTLQLTEELLLR